ncbi:MAG: xanthine dehydrogenase subunit D, partial [Acidimicrobiales bacterium]
MTTTESPPTTAPVRPPSASIGTSRARPDGGAKVRGEFAFSSDLWAEGALWGKVLRSPCPSARITGIDCAAARRLAGVHAVLLAEDLPGNPLFGVETRDQPVFASDVVRYMGEPIAAVAADHPETARRAVELIEVGYEVLEPLVDPAVALDPSTAPMHPDGNVVRHI